MIIVQPGQGGNCFSPKSNWMQAASNSPPVAGPALNQRTMEAALVVTVMQMSAAAVVVQVLMTLNDQCCCIEV